MTVEPSDHKHFLETVVIALNRPESSRSAAFENGHEDAGERDGAALRALATDDAWEAGGLRGLWRLRRDKVTFSSAGVLSPHAPRTLGCVRYERLADASKPPRSAFALLSEDATAGFRVEGVYEEIPLALAWLRGWITPGQRVDRLPSDASGEALAAELVAVPHGGLGAFLSERLDADPAITARADDVLPDGPAKVLGVHAMPIIGRTLVGIAVGDDALWLVIERHPDDVGGRAHLVSVLVRPSLSALVTGARAFTTETERAESDLFLERLLAAVRGRASSQNRPVAVTTDEQRERFREELMQRLSASFGKHIPADEAVIAALRQTLQSSAPRAKNIGELVAQVLGRLVDRT